MQANRNKLFFKDVFASFLYFAPVQAIIPLSAFIAANRFTAPPVLVGAMITGAYFGFIGNLFISRVLSRLDLRQSIVALMSVSAAVLVLVGFQRAAIPFCISVLAYLICYGIAGVQYNSLIKYLYTEDERVSRLSYRYGILSAGGMVVSVVFGRVSAQYFQLTFTVTAVAALAAAFAFRAIRVGHEAGMPSFNVRHIFDVFRESPALRLVALGLGFYGVVGSAIHIPLTYLYTEMELTENSVGIITAVRVGTIVLSSLFLTPRLRLRGGLANFRVVFSCAALSIILFLIAGRFVGGIWGIVLVVAGNIVFAVSVSSFEVGIKTTALQLAPEGRSTLYVNALMIVFGIRGVLWPIVVGAAMQATGHGVMFMLCLAAAVICLALSLRRTPVSDR